MVAFPRKRNRFRRREKPRPAFDIRPLKKRVWDTAGDGIWIQVRIRAGSQHLETISFWRETSEFVGREEALRGNSLG